MIDQLLIFRLYILESEQAACHVGELRCAWTSLQSHEERGAWHIEEDAAASSTTESGGYHDILVLDYITTTTTPFQNTVYMYLQYCMYVMVGSVSMKHFCFNYLLTVTIRST